MSRKFKGLFGTLLIALIFSQVASAETLTIRSDAWPPYNGETEGPGQGYMILVLKEIFKRHDVDIDYQLLSWDDSLDAVRKGAFNAVVGAATEDAPDFVYPAESFGESDTAFFVVSNNDWKFKGIKSLKDIRLGVVSDYSYFDALDKYIKSNDGTRRIYTASGDDPLADLIDLLLKGDIDAIAEDSNVMLNVLMAKKVPMGIIASAGREKSVNIYIAFSPRDPRSAKYAAIFDAGIADLRKNGRLKSILSLYWLTDWKTH